MRKSIKILCLLIISIVIFAGFSGFQAQDRPSSSDIDLLNAAKKNSELQYSLTWTFGKKAQRGWYLYVPLLQKTLDIEAKQDSAEFAGAVKKWQQRRGVRATGVLEGKTLYSLIKYWQSRRLKPIVLAKEESLLSAPISDFYDPTRNIELLKVERETYAAYKKMIAAAINDKLLDLKADEKGNLLAEEKFLTLVSTYRSPDYQASLRKQLPGASRAQIAFKSPHFTGHALDIYVGGEPVTTKDFNRAIQIKTPAYRWLVKNAEQFGFYNYFYEPWHWEYVPNR